MSFGRDEIAQRDSETPCDVRQGLQGGSGPVFDPGHGCLRKVGPAQFSLSHLCTNPHLADPLTYRFEDPCRFGRWASLSANASTPQSSSPEQGAR